MLDMSLAGLGWGSQEDGGRSCVVLIRKELQGGKSLDWTGLDVGCIVHCLC